MLARGKKITHLVERVYQMSKLHLLRFLLEKPEHGLENPNFLPVNLVP